MKKENLEFLKNVVGSASAGITGGVTLLREIVKQVADRAPPDKLVLIGELLVDMGIDE